MMNRCCHSVSALTMGCGTATVPTFPFNPHDLRAVDPLHTNSSANEAEKSTRRQRTSWRESTGRMCEVHVPASRFMYFAIPLFALRAQRGILLCEAIGYRRNETRHA